MPTVSPVSDRAFVDTNIFAYAEDVRETAKRPKALALIRLLTDQGRLVISTQVINEFCAILLRGRVGAVTNEADLSALIEEMEAAADVLVLSAAESRAAIHAVYAYGLSWYDALIWAAAREAGCGIIYTEDLPGMPVIDGVRYVNPFAGEHEG
jgi:predicted nucleic acid-binding protein